MIDNLPRTILTEYRKQSLLSDVIQGFLIHSSFNIENTISNGLGILEKDKRNHLCKY